MSSSNGNGYVESVEFRRTASATTDDWMVIHCVAGDTYEAFLEDGAWWLAFFAGDPSEGPFATPDAVTEWLNTDQ